MRHSFVTCFCLLPIVVVPVMSGCTSLSGPAIGQLELGLSSGIGEAQFRLVNANFLVSGAADLELSSDSEPESDVLARALPAGQYSVQLLDGWQLERVGPMGASPVPAELVSNNPLAFGIAADQITRLTFQFQTTGTDAAVDAGGQVLIGIEVDGAEAPNVIITELMKNPQALSDANGEWVELHNAGSEPVELSGCSLARDDQAFPFENGLSIEAGSFIALANGEDPGFVPALSYGSVTLPNSSPFTLSVRCGDQVLDSVSFDASSFNRAGRSLSLSAGALDDVANDGLANWCEGSTPYNADFGTPGAPNPDCVP